MNGTRCQSGTGTVDSDLAAKLEAAKAPSTENGVLLSELAELSLQERVAQAKEAVSLFRTEIALHSLLTSHKSAVLRTELCGRNFLSPEINQPLLTEIFLSFVPKARCTETELSLSFIDLAVLLCWHALPESALLFLKLAYTVLGTGGHSRERLHFCSCWTERRGHAGTDTGQGTGRNHSRSLTSS